jgi:hypothetical protein
MRGLPIPDPVRHRMLALLGGAGAVLLAALPASADPAGPPPNVGPPTALVAPAPRPAPQPAAHATPAAAAQSAHGAPAGQPAKHAAASPQQIPLDTKPIIPPAPTTAKLSPSPEPRPALPLETGLQPTGEARSRQPGASDSAPPPNPKPPSS